MRTRGGRPARAALAAEAFEQLEKAVGRLLLIYEANDELNNEQPSFAEASYAMSIDEWLGCVGEGKRQWQALSRGEKIEEE